MRQHSGMGGWRDCGRRRKEAAEQYFRSYGTVYYYVLKTWFYLSNLYRINLLSLTSKKKK